MPEAAYRQRTEQSGILLPLFRPRRRAAGSSPPPPPPPARRLLTVRPSPVASSALRPYRSVRRASSAAPDGLAAAAKRTEVRPSSNFSPGDPTARRLLCSTEEDTVIPSCLDEVRLRRLTTG